MFPVLELRSAMVPLAALVFVFSGCVGSNAASKDGGAGNPLATASGPAGFDENTGGVEGVVVDQESAPIPGAEVGVKGASNASVVSVLSDASGHYALSNVVPGDYQLFAQKLGYDSTATTVNVQAGHATQKTIILSVLPVHTGYSSVWSREGYFQCSSSIAGSTGPCGFLPVAGNVTQISSLFDTNHRAFEYPVGGGVMSAFNELTWRPGSFATGTTLSVTFSYDQTKRTTGHWFCNAERVSPINMHWERGDDLSDKTKGTCVTGGSQYGSSGNEMPTISYEKGLLLRTFMNTGKANVAGQTTSNFGLAYEQHFTVYFSMFYYDRAPDGYTALKDA